MIESPAEISVARSGYGVNEFDRRLMSVAPHFHAFDSESPLAWIVCVRRDDMFLQERERLCRLESGSRRIGTECGAVEQRVVFVLHEFGHIVATFLSLESSRVV